jgi:hypothetical protein
VSYRDKTYVASAGEDIRYYWMMEAWRENEHIDSGFFAAHDSYKVRDTSEPESIKARLKNAKRFVLSGGSVAERPKIVECALEDYAVTYSASSNVGPHQYTAGVHKQLGL